MKITGLDNVNAESLPKDWSETFEYKENLDRLRSALKDFEKYSHIIVIGNGGQLLVSKRITERLTPIKRFLYFQRWNPDFLRK